MKRAVAWAVALAILGCGCGGKKDARAPQHVTQPPPGGRKPPAQLPVTGHMLTSIGDRSIGPFASRHGSGENARGLVAWVTPAEGMGRRVVVLPLAASGEPRGPERTLAIVPVDTTMLVVRPMRGAAPGFVVAWTALVDRGETLWAGVVNDEGVARSKAVELARTSDDVVWVDVVPTDLGAVCVWAEETRGGDANVLAAALDTDGKVRSPSSRIARGASGWHALEVPGGVGVSTVGAKPGDARGGVLTFQKLDADGRGASPPMMIAQKPTVSGDVEVVRAGERTVFVWTDHSAEEPFVATAAIDEKGNVEPPRKLAQGRGGASLIGLASGPAGAAVLFESPARRKTELRRMYLARISSSLALEGKAYSFESVGRTPPEISATETGFAVLAPLRDCEDGSPSCADAAVAPTLVRTDAHIAVVQRELFDFDGELASLAWNFSCERDRCHALAASGGPPARVRATEVLPRANVAAPVSKPPAAVDGPHVSDVAAVVSGEAVTDIALARIGDATMIATLATRPDGAAHLLTTRMLDPNGAVSAPSSLSTRALAVGGVSVAAAEKPEDGAAIAWVARENGDPEVHVTRVDKRGRRTNDVQLTTTKGDASDVAIAWAGGGWIVAWVDGRDGNGEVYATKVSLDLQRIAREERITKAPGDASDLVVLARGDLVWLAWADPRESPRDGMADVYVTAVKKHDAKRALDEQRVLATAGHSRTPQLATADAAIHVAWIEEAPAGTESPSSSGYGAMWAKLDEKGALLTKPVRVPLAGDGVATSVTLEASAGIARAVVARSNLDAIAIDAVDLAKTPRASPLLTLDGPPSLDVALVLDNGILYFNDDGPALADKRARRARIAW